MGTDNFTKAADKVRSLLRDRSGISSVGVARNESGAPCVRVDVDPSIDKDMVRRLLAPIDVPVVVRTVAGLLRAH